MKTRNLVTVLAAASAFTFLGANAAVAADYKMTTLGHFVIPGGTMEFTKYGDIVKVCDTDADGMAAKGWVHQAGGGGTRYTLQAGGKGTCVTKRASLGGVYDIPEGGTHEFLVCLHTSSSDGYCNRENWKNNG